MSLFRNLEKNYGDLKMLKMVLIKLEKLTFEVNSYFSFEIIDTHDHIYID